MYVPVATRSPEAGTKSEMEETLELQRRALMERGAPDYHRRREALDALLRALLARQEGFIKAINDDFGGRARQETLLLEVFPLVEEIRHAKRHLKRWMKPKRVATGWAFLPARARVVYQPVGVVGIASPWNYPLLLTLSPLICALSAGNHVMLKPSEFAPRTAALVKEMLSEIFPADYVSVVLGDAEVSAEFTSLPFDHLIFTGSTQVGTKVMRAASENLTPVTLELGGKSPTLLQENYPLEDALPRIMTGKLYNAGQTCIAPDYVLVQENAREKFIEGAADVVAKLYPGLVDNPDYTRVINARQYERLKGLLSDAQAKGASVLQVNPRGEDCNALNRVFPPTLVSGVTDEMTLMQEEIFGPILPVVTYRTMEDALKYINDRPRPLALYYFDEDRRRVNEVLSRTISGGVTINDVILHIAQNNLPFGGIGPSGMGQYHGFDGFETFSKKKGVLLQSRFSAVGILRPPYGNLAGRMIKFLIGRR
jgi:coniferyl-aldehyde dehydrogenase